MVQTSSKWGKFGLLTFKFDLEGRSLHKTTGTLIKLICTFGPNLVILTWTHPEISRGQASDWHTDWHTKTKIDGSWTSAYVKRPISPLLMHVLMLTKGHHFITCLQELCLFCQHTWTWCYDTTEPFHKWFMSSELRSWEFFCCNYDSNDQIRLHFCTCYDSWASKVCVKLWPDLVIIIFYIRSISIFMRLGL